MSIDNETISDAIAVHAWVLATDKGSLEGLRCPVFSPGELHRTHAQFKKRPRAELDKALDVLQHAAIITAPINEVGDRGRQKETRALNSFFVPGEGMTAEKMSDVVRGVLTWPANADISATAPAPEAPTVVPTGKLRVLREFKTGVAGGFQTFTAGQIIDDFHLCEQLRAQNAPVCSADNERAAQCPACNHCFEISDTPAEGQPPIMIFLADQRFGFGVNFMIKQKGDLEADPRMVEHMLATKVQIRQARPDEAQFCPACGKLFKVEAIMGVRHN